LDIDLKSLKLILCEEVFDCLSRMEAVVWVLERYSLVHWTPRAPKQSAYLGIDIGYTDVQIITLFFIAVAIPLITEGFEELLVT
jgi:hypothetical protein